MTELEMALTVAVVVAGTMTTRYISFAVFAAQKEPPALVRYLGTVLPGAVMGLLVVYSLKDTILVTWPYGLPEIIASVVLVAVHLWRRNVLLSMAVGTILYMLLVQLVFH
ncbi:branched-chain amino acid transporter permease [Megasphaera vaginalis (ex Srinivasan et al. 2021)]|uniref:Branched-chain amino acid transport protein AzlD n=1 Tax=Megasphaera vaginalis (ex Srinivasan et al. 2021) TaxID=1111454 RepID=U7UGS0_9FIRM|nr:AzlD domain-containing protein [Megasphaera vaginalis (ex Srinivasan et al. 2021)]ERT58627.1 branched-chain amino acid transport protein AzlD [Megasphaera vaginalis (ex Srinivasan et al. 2021)]